MSPPWAGTGPAGPGGGESRCRSPRLGDEIIGRAERFVVVEVDVGAVVAEAEDGGRTERFAIEQLEQVGEGVYREVQR